VQFLIGLILYHVAPGDDIEVAIAIDIPHPPRARECAGVETMRS